MLPPPQLPPSPPPLLKCVHWKGQPDGSHNKSNCTVAGLNQTLGEDSKLASGGGSAHPILDIVLFTVGGVLLIAIAYFAYTFKIWDPEGRKAAKEAAASKYMHVQSQVQSFGMTAMSAGSSWNGNLSVDDASEPTSKASSKRSRKDPTVLMSVTLTTSSIYGGTEPSDVEMAAPPPPSEQPSVPMWMPKEADTKRNTKAASKLDFPPPPSDASGGSGPTPPPPDEYMQPPAPPALHQRHAYRHRPSPLPPRRASR